jgi:glycosyltransferase involved in cell wall biosynthesis
LQAFKIVLDKQEECHLIIAGSGSFDLYMKECEDIWMNVTWTGLIDKAKLYDLYSIADVGLMPSLHEQCSYVAIEMMMHGVPLIASTSTGLCEMVEDGVTGLHIPVIEHSDRVEIDIPLLAEKMLYLLKHPEERKRMGANARKRYEQLYTTEVMRKNMLNFYTTLYDT